jgi:hypothetical protein
MRRFAGSAWILSLGIASAACGGSEPPSKDPSTMLNEIHKSVARDMVNEQKRTCMVAGASCHRLGTWLLHADFISKRKSWAGEAVDKDGARKAFTRGCEHRDAQSCAALVEYDLVQDDAGRDWAVRRAAFYGRGIRSKEEVDKEQLEAAKTAEKNDAEEKKSGEDADRSYRESLAASASQSGGGGGGIGIGDVLGGAWRAYRFTKEVQAASKAVSNTKLDTLTRVDETMKHTNEASRALTDKPLVGEGGNLVDICTPCSDQAKDVAAACKGGMSNTCLGATKKLSSCMETAKCDK